MSDQSTPLFDQLEEQTVEYRNIPGFPGYRVGDDGSLWSCKKRGGNWSSGLDVFVSKWKRLSCSKNKDGYRHTTVCRDRVCHYAKISTLVLMAFVGPRPDEMQAAHENGIPDDDRLENLSWKTCMDNNEDKRRHGTLRKGEDIQTAKLTPDKVIEIRLRYVAGETKRGLARAFNVSQKTVQNILAGKAWAWVI